MVGGEDVWGGGAVELGEKPDGAKGEMNLSGLQTESPRVGDMVIGDKAL